MADDQQTPTVVTTGKNVDVYTIPGLRIKLREAVDQHQHVAVDLDSTDWMDSSGLAMLVGLRRYARAQEHEVFFVCNREQILGLFRTTGLDQVLDVRTSIEEGRANG